MPRFDTTPPSTAAARSCILATLKHLVLLEDWVDGAIKRLEAILGPPHALRGDPSIILLMRSRRVSLAALDAKIRMRFEALSRAAVYYHPDDAEEVKQAHKARAAVAASEAVADLAVWMDELLEISSF